MLSDKQKQIICSNSPIGWIHSFVNVHLIHGNRMFWLTVSVSKNITTSKDTIGTNKKLSGSVWKYSNIFGCVRVDTACLVVQPSTPLSLTRFKYTLISLLLPLTRILFSMNNIVFDRVSASLIINGRNACNVRSSFTYDGNCNKKIQSIEHLAKDEDFSYILPPSIYHMLSQNT